jgi:hypothetical protein
MGAGQNETGARASFGFGGRVSETGTRKERPLEGGSRSRGVKEQVDVLRCLLAPQCGERHKAMACEKFRGLSLPHRQSIIAEQELCANCLRHSENDVRRKKDCLRRAAEPHWVGSSVRRPRRTPSPVEEMPTPGAPAAGKVSYACRMEVMVKTKADLRQGEYGADLSVLFCPTRQMTAVVESVAIEKGIPWRAVPEVTVMLGDGRRETSTKLFLIEVKATRSYRASKEPEPILIAAYGVQNLAPFAAAAPELPLLRHRFPSARPASMGLLAQEASPVDLVIARDYRKQWPTVASPSCFQADDLYLMRSNFYPGQLLYGLADPDAVGIKMKGAKRKFAPGKGESAGSSTSSSRRPRAATPAAVSPEKRRHESPSPIRRVREKSRESPSPARRARRRSRGPPSRSLSAVSSTERRRRSRSVSSCRSSMNGSPEREEKESPAKMAPAKKRKVRVLSSSSNEDDSHGGDEIIIGVESDDEFSSSSSSSSNSSSEDETVTEIWIVDEEEEERLRKLDKQREKQKERQEALEDLVRKRGIKSVLREAETFEAAQHAAKEKSAAAKAKQQGRRAVAGSAAARGERGSSEGESSRRRTEEGEQAGPAPPPAGGASAAVAGDVRREQRKSGSTSSAAGGTSEKAVAAKSAKEDRTSKPAAAAAGEASAAAAGKTERSRGGGGPTPPATGGTSAVAVGKPVQESGPAKVTPTAVGGSGAAAANESEEPDSRGKSTPSAAGGSKVMVAGGPEKESRPEKAAQPATGGTSAAAAAADKSERAGGKGRPPPPMAGGAKAVAAARPEQVSRPAGPALPPTREVGAAAAGAVQQAGGVSGSCSSYKIPRLLSPIQGGYMENFQALPKVLEDCIIRIPETVQEKFFFSVLMESGLMLSGRAAREYSGAHFKFQRKPERQRK